MSGAKSSGLTRERSFVRMSQTASNKRRSLQQPAMEIYRPPSNESYNDLILHGLTKFLSQIIDTREFQNKLNVNAPEFKLKCEGSNTFPQFIQHSKSSGNIHQQIQLAAAARKQKTQIMNSSSNQPVLFSHPFEVLDAKISAPSSDRVQTDVSI